MQHHYEKWNLLHYRVIEISGVQNQVIPLRPLHIAGKYTNKKNYKHCLMFCSLHFQ